MLTAQKHKNQPDLSQTAIVCHPSHYTGVAIGLSTRTMHLVRNRDCHCAGLFASRINLQQLGRMRSLSAARPLSITAYCPVLHILYGGTSGHGFSRIGSIYTTPYRIAVTLFTPRVFLRACGISCQFDSVHFDAIAHSFSRHFLIKYDHIFSRRISFFPCLDSRGKNSIHPNIRGSEPQHTPSQFPLPPDVSLNLSKPMPGTDRTLGVLEISNDIV